MNYNNRTVLTDSTNQAIKGLVGLIDAIQDAPLGGDGNSGTFTLEDGTQVTLSYQINDSKSTTTITVRRGASKYTIVEENETEQLAQEFRNGRPTHL